ncbi:amino acid adenylation domain-containing protein [Planktothrix sp. FACHB-1355]|uniref:non-ribosomal peptide synthetase n=1 Tax=Planktothrix sp. FACHB-1355 TaxID=2692854 RepID=UPI00168ACB8B|nr:non-ribosomal peptide synthetase [Planktothrix sp. FACHB-1355]MBD3557662.1 amino acid adenylation domain-containing protein [Planktothrix sp. FACHB-1355]
MNRNYIEAVYNLSPLQAGMQFHSLLSPDSKSYFQQLCCDLKGVLDVEVFQNAWRTVVRRHGVLRTAFVWEGLDKMLQVVQREVDFEIELLNFEEFSESVQKHKLDEFLTADKVRGIDLAKAPLMRITLIKTGAENWFLIWSHHHILLDGWSLTIILKEIFAIYEAKLQGIEIDLPPETPYREYIKWINEQDKIPAKDYWENKLKRITHPSRLAVQKNTAVFETQPQAFVEIKKTLDIKTTNLIKQFCRENRLTLNTLTQGAWAYLLSRYSGDEKVVFGVTINGRPTDIPNSDEMVGLFINTLPFCVEVKPPTMTLDWLQEIQKQQGELEQFSYSSLVDVQGWSRIPRGTPLFETILVFENFPFTDAGQSSKLGISIENAFLNEQTNYPLTAVGVPGKEMTLLLSYNTSRFDHETAACLLENWSSVLTSIACEEPRTLSRIKLISNAEEKQLTGGESETIRLSDEEHFLHKIFEKQVESRPRNIAVATENEEISFAELNGFANRLAHFLIARGVVAETRVGICLNRCWQMIGAMLAVLKAGGVYVPLNPDTPFERLKFMVEDSKLAAIVTERELLGSLPAEGLHQFVVGRDERLLEKQSAANPNVEVEPENEAYIIYTSGSTGNPKGVIAEHKGIANFTLDIIRKLGLHENHRMLQFAPLSFDASAIQIYPPLLAGGGVVLNRKVTELSNLEILEYCLEKRVSVIDFPAGYWHQWLDEIETRGLKIDSGIKIFLTGGDRLSVEKLRQWARLAESNALFLSSYGPTETTVSATVFITTRDRILENNIGNSQIGQPLTNVQVFVIDPRWLQPVPVGVGGELYISGYGLARNYLNSSDLTAEKFLPNPFSGQAGSRMYKTGDSVKYLPDGGLEFLGRSDQQVKIRGLRVEIGEIERELKKHTEIQEAVVLALEEESGEKKLAGFIKTAKDVEILPQELRNHLKKHLPEYMIPTAFFKVSQFPLLASGKIDRQRLRAEKHAKLVAFESFLPARNPVEQTVAEVWKEVLEQENIGINQDFFELGGHSLIATQLISRIRTIFRLEIPLQSLFQNATVAEFSAFLQKELARNEASAVPKLARAVRPAKIPLSFSQERLLFIDRMLDKNSIFNLTGILKIEGNPDFELLEQSINAVIDRHEALRTSFAEDEGQSIQIIHPTRPIRLKNVNFTETGDAGIDGIVGENVNREINTPFDLEKDALIRARLLSFGGELHYLLITIHHIVCDGWSMGILTREIANFYRHLRGGKAVELPNLPIQYADYALWQRNWLEGSDFEGELQYWTKRLQNLPPALEIPTDFDRPPVQTYAGAQERVELSLEMTAALKKLARQEGVTLFMLLLGAYKLLLYKYLSRTDIVIGTPIAGRNQLETEGLIGFFLNTLVLRTDLSGNPTFRQIFQNVRETCLEAYANQNIPFEKLIEVLNPERDRSRTPLAQMVFNMLNLPEEKIELENLSITGVLPEDQWSKFDLTIYAGETDQKLFINLVYNTALYSPSTIRQILAHYQKLLAEILKNPNAEIDSLRLVTDEELEQIYTRHRKYRSAGNSRIADEEFAPNIAAQFEKQVNGSATALNHGEEKISYEQLGRLADKIAGLLVDPKNGSHVGKGVGLLFGHNAAMVAAILGTLKSGRFYVPLDAFHPVERLAEILVDSQCECVLTESGFKTEARKIVELVRSRENGRAVEIINVENSSESYNLDRRAVSISPEQTAYILYTSGSTGKPKGIFQSHQNVLKHIRTYSKSLELTARDKILLLASYGFDASVMDIFGALLNGAELCLYDLRKKGFGDLENFIKNNGVTVYHSTPTVFRTFAGNLSGSEALDCVRKVVLGGEEVFDADIDIFNRFFGKTAVLINGLGPTESTLALQYFVAHGQKPKRRSVPVGYPVENTRILLLDESGKESGIFGTGEIAIESERLALGYWNREDLTAQAFSRSETNPETRLYRTGDLGKRLPDYSLVFLGRKDLQIKIRGQRVEIGEIEAKLNDLPEIEMSAVVARKVDEKNTRLIGFVVPSGKSSVEMQAVRQRLRRELPDYMIPELVLEIETLPLTATGKIDRRKLLDLEIPAPAKTGNFAPPETHSQRVLHSIWCELLNLAELGIDEDFFAVGGHSLIATQIITRVRRELGVNPELREIFELPTIRALAARVDEISGNSPGQSLDFIPKRTSETSLPLANAQKRLWFLNELEPGNPAYNMSSGFKIKGRLDLEALTEAINRLVQRHESLRTVIVENDGHPQQVVKPFEDVTLNFTDLSSSDPDERENAAENLLREAIRKPFDLSIGPLFRHLVVKLTDDKFYLMFCLHHIICDGWSIGVFTRELAVLYMAVSAGEHAELPELPFQYADFAVWQNGEENQTELLKQVEYWKNQLGNDPASLKLPYDRPLPDELTYKGEHKNFQVDLATTRRLEKICRRNGVTMFMLMLTAWKVLFMRYGEQEEIVVGIPVAGRSLNGTEGLLGMFVNTLVIRTFLSGAMSFENALAEVRKTCLEAYAHQDLPFETLVSALKPTRDLSRVPLFEVMFNWLNFYENPEEIARSTNILSKAGLHLEQMAVENNLTKFDISLILSEGDKGISGVVEYNTALFDPVTIERMLSSFQTLLDSIIKYEGLSISRLPLVSETELAQNFSKYAQNQSDDIENRFLVHQYFEKQSDLNPHRQAVVFRGESLSYGELEEKANRLANYLRSKGIGVETTVGVCLDRSLDMVIAVLGVVKTGAAYVPLDPEYPAERLKFMLDDSKSEILLTTSKFNGIFADRRDRIIDLDETAGDIEGHSPERPHSAAVPENLFYIIYTSGSTGVPKGAMNIHRGVGNRLLWMQNHYGLDENDKILQMSSFGFDFSNWEIFGTLAAGATLVIPEPDAGRDFDSVAKVIDDCKVTVAHFVPSQLRLFLDSDDAEKCTSLKKIFCGGEALTLALIEKCRQKVGAGIFNQYGPTETSIDVTFWDCPETFAEATVPIGQPNANNCVYILDRYGMPVPTGCFGEIHIGGEAVGRGYCGKPSETAERFVPDPFSSRIGARMYKTGDSGRYNNRGLLEFRGRLDNQVKLRGYRIEPGEIEKVILESAAVEETAVILSKTTGDEEKLAAYLVPRTGINITVGDLREHLGKKLPHYMIPSVFVMLEKLPLNSNGKLDRRGLPEPEKSSLELGSDFEKPVSEVEEKLSRVWAEVLGLEKVGINDNFFALGGDSIISIQIVVKAREQGLNFNPRQLFKYQTIAELAPFTDYKQKTHAEQGILVGTVPLSPIQIDFFERELEDPNNYSQAVLINVGKSIEPEKMRRCVELLLRHHDVLRSRFLKSGVSYEQTILEHETAKTFDIKDLTSISHNDKQLALNEIVDQTRSLISVENGPVFVVRLINWGEDEGWRLLLTAHHLVVDGVSWRIIGEHLAKLYQAETGEEKTKPGEKTCSFRQWSTAISRDFDYRQALEKGSFWLNNAGSSRVFWNPDYPAGENTEQFAERLTCRLDAPETKILINEIPTAFDSQITNILLIAWLQAVREWNDTDKILVAVEGHGRDEIEAIDVTATVGWFTTVTPVLLEAVESPDLLVQVAAADETINRCLDNGLYFRRLRYFGQESEREFLKKEWQPKVSFNYLGQIRTTESNNESWKLALESAAGSILGGNRRQYELDVNLVVVGGKLETSLTFSRRRYEVAGMRSLLDLFVKKLRRFVRLKDDIFGGVEADKNTELIKGLDQAELDEILAEVEFEI